MCSFPELKWDSSSKLHNPENDPSDYYLSSFKDDTQVVSYQMNKKWETHWVKQVLLGDSGCNSLVDPCLERLMKATRQLVFPYSLGSLMVSVFLRCSISTIHQKKCNCYHQSSSSMAPVPCLDCSVFALALARKKQIAK